MTIDPLEGVLVRLPLITEDEATVMIEGGRLDPFAEGYPRQDDIDAARMVGRGGDEARAWSVRHIVRLDDGVAVGTIGFFGQPDEDGRVEVGFGLVEAARGKGLATDALTAVIKAAEAAGAQVIAHTAPDNIASQRTLAKCGFVREDAAKAHGEWRYVRPGPDNNDHRRCS
jgi:RimJ/RimL family protein N-acetyltransferase